MRHPVDAVWGMGEMDRDTGAPVVTTLTEAPTVYTSAGDAARLEREWRRLAEASPAASYFCAPEWQLSWWETLGVGRPAEVAVWWGPDRALEAVVPLMVDRDRLHPRLPIRIRCRTILGSGATAADHIGILAAPRRADAVRSWLSSRARDTTLLLSGLDPDAGVPLAPLQATRVGASRCPRVNIQAWLDGDAGSAKFRKRLRAYGRQLKDAGVSFRWVPAGGVDAALLDVLFELHSLRSAAKGWRSLFGISQRQFHLRLCGRATRNRGPAALVAEQAGTTVGVLYGFRWRDVFAFYQAGWAMQFASSSLGTVLVSEAIRCAAEDGATVFDFLRGDEDYKYRFGAVDRPDETWLAPRGLSGRLLAAKYAWVSSHHQQPGRR